VIEEAGVEERGGVDPAVQAADRRVDVDPRV
jgi:hypothetical protein